ncbi:MAG: hypothetical protein CME84_11985 [Henriciella sp.]|nr:hypothetical protein [Henriciella sp.]
MRATRANGMAGLIRLGVGKCQCPKHLMGHLPTLDRPSLIKGIDIHAWGTGRVEIVPKKTLLFGSEIFDRGRAHGQP